MNQERFDGLARGLATGRLTRWQVLKGLWAGVLLGSTGFLQPWSGSFAEAQTRAVKKAPVGSLSNPRKDYVGVGSCKEFNTYIKKTGVTDERKKNYKGDTAVTTYSCGWDLTQSKVKDTSRNKNRVCLRTTQVLVKFEVETTVTVATWKPPKRLSAACECEKTNYDVAAIEHERWHVNDIREVETFHTEAWNNNQPVFEACGYGKDAEKEAKKALRKKISERANKKCLRISKEIKSRADKYDKTHTLQPMDCSFCKPGKKASQNASDSKCVSETCGPNRVTCPPDKADCCNGQCVNTQTDPNNCGSCGKTCTAGQTCKQGKCEKTTKCGGVSCPPDYPDCCNGRCTDLQRSPYNCGACGNRCGHCEGCYQGRCGCGGPGVQCPSGQVCCAGPGVSPFCTRGCPGGGCAT